METVSFSKLSTFQTCPRKYRHIYIGQVKRPPLSKMIFGTSSHAVQEFAALPQIEGKSRPKIKDQIDYFADNLDKELSNGVEYDEGDNKDLMQKDGIQAIEQYEPVGAILKPLAVEKSFNISLKDEDYTVNGRIDLITEDAVIDRKFGKKIINPENMRVQVQLLMYDFARKLLATKDKIFDGVKNLKIHSYRRLKSGGKFSDIDVIPAFSENKVMSNVIQTVQMIKQSEKSDNFPMFLGDACGWCQYRDLCGLPK